MAADSSGRLSPAPEKGQESLRRSPSPRLIRWLTSLLVGLLLSQPTASVVVAQHLSEPSTKPSAVEIAYDPATDLVSIKSLDAPLGTVLRQVAVKTRVTMTLPKEVLDQRVSVEFNRLPLEHALKRLLEGFNSTLVYDLASGPISSASNEAPTARLAKIIVLSRKAAREVRSGYETMSPNYEEPAAQRPAEMLRALIEGRPEMARGAVDALREPSREQERERIVVALLERLDNGLLVPPDGVLVALKELAPERARDALVERLSGGDPRMRVIAAAALGRLGDEGAVQPLLSILTENDEVARRVAASSLALIGGQQAMDALLQSYVAGDNRIRYPVSVAIASFGDERSQKALAKLTAAGLVPREPTAEEAGRTNRNQQ